MILPPATAGWEGGLGALNPRAYALGYLLSPAGAG